MTVNNFSGWVFPSRIFKPKDKSKLWGCLVYPDSVAPNWISFLTTTGVRFCVSPLHDQDMITTDDEDALESLDNLGKPKKPHYHVILSFSNTTTGQFVQSILESINAFKYPIRLHSVTGYYKYLTHSDDPKKHHYATEDIQCYNGFDLKEEMLESKYDIARTCIWIEKFINENDVHFYDNLINMLSSSGLLYEYSICKSNIYHFSQYIRDRNIHCKRLSKGDNTTTLSPLVTEDESQKGSDNYA